MATYYVRKTGSNSNGGTSPSDAWLTIAKALGSTGIASGDTVYVGAGIYREAVTVAMTSATAETRVIGDVTGQFTGDAGEVRLTAYATNDKTLPVSASALALAGRDYLTFQSINFVGGTGVVVDANTATSTNITFRKCSFQLGSGVGSVFIDWTGAAGVVANWLVENCIFGVGGIIKIRFNTVVSGSSDFDLGVTIQNCIMHAGGNFAIAVAGLTGSGKAGGVKVLNNTLMSLSGFSVGAVGSTTIPCLAYGNLIISPGGTGLSANTSGQITEDYNLINASTARSLVTAGANSISNGSYAVLMHFGQNVLRGQAPRPFAMPLDASPLLGFGTGTGVPTTDLTGANRPAGGSSLLYSAGAYERSDSGAKETTTIRTVGGSALKLTGPGYHDFQVPVDATSTTISIYGRYDSTHAATNKPQMQILNGSECGVADATVTMTAAVDTWELLSSTFTPTAKGIVTVRLISRAAAGGGIAYFDD